MTAERSARALTLFERARERCGDEREAFLRDACGSEPELRALIDQLLAADAKPHGLLDQTPSAVAQLLASPRDGKEGVCVGPYCIERELGRGGMGVVYLAERQDVGMRVALKLLSSRFAAPELVDRFRYECRVLSLLEHPHIARFLDTGVGPDNTPWLAMEYVEGRPIDEYCDAHLLTVEARLRLFEKVGEAVAHAHRSLLVHRDIKPTNVLVTSDGEAKLVDFGIAKLVEDSEQGTGLTVSHGGVGPMTPEYASPEQLRGDPITTASDVYQLGILLHRLLTGRGPTGPDGDALSHAARLAEVVPARPSRALETSPSVAEPDDSPAHVSGLRGVSPTKLRRQLVGDLDNIVQMALRPEPSRRYASAQEMVDDLRRHRSGRPIVARPGSLGYKIGKFVRRHRAASILAGTLAMIVVGSALILAVQGRRVALERDRAESVASVLESLVGRADPTAVEPEAMIPPSVLAATRAQAQAGLGESPETWGRILGTIGRVYRNSGQVDTALVVWEEALAALEPVTDDRHPVVLDLLGWLGAIHTEEGDFDRGISYLERAMAGVRQLDSGRRLELGDALLDLGFGLQVSGDLDRAAAQYEEGLRVLETLTDSGGLHYDRGLINMGFIADSRGDPERAAQLFRQAADRRTRRFGRDDLRTANAQAALAGALLRLGRLDEAAALAEASMAIRRARLPDPHRDLASGNEVLARVRLAQGRLDEAERLAIESSESFARVYGEPHGTVAFALVALGDVLTEQGRSEKASETYRRAVRQYRATLGDDHASTWAATVLLAGSEVRLGHLEEAERLYDEALPRLDALRGHDASFAGPLTGYAEVLAGTGRCAEARALLRRAESLARSRWPPADDRVRRPVGLLERCT